MARALLLDLDTTLVNSVPDRTAASSWLVASRGLATFTEPEVAMVVEDGVAKESALEIATRRAGRHMRAGSAP